MASLLQGVRYSPKLICCPACRILDVSWSPAARSEIQPAASDDITYGRLLGPTISLTTGDVASNLGRHFTTTKGQLSSKDYKYPSTALALSPFIYSRWI